MKLNNENEGTFGDFIHGVFNLKNIDKMGLYVNGIHMFNEFLDSQDDISSYKPYFKKLEGNLLGKMAKIYSNVGRGKVLNHGDFHGLNVMFKYSDSEKTDPEGVLLVDYQFCIWGPVVIDLLYALHTFFPLDYATDLNNRDFVIKHYFDHLKHNLESIEFEGKIPSLKDLHKDLIDFSLLEVFFLTTTMPISLMFEVENDTFETDKTGLQRFYYHPKYIAKVKELLPLYLNRGWLEDN